MTETSPVTCINPRYGTKKASSIGMPVPDTEFKLVDPETGQLAELGQPGEIAIRGPQLMKEYLDKPEETANALRDGWMFTGDVAKMDEDGYFYIVDRVKDMVIVSGFKVFTRELDEVLTKHPDVEMAASIGIPDPERRARSACRRRRAQRGQGERTPKGRTLRAYLKRRWPPSRSQGHRVHGPAAHQRRGQDPQARAEGGHAGQAQVGGLSLTNAARRRSGPWPFLGARMPPGNGAGVLSAPRWV